MNRYDMTWWKWDDDNDKFCFWLLLDRMCNVCI